MKNLLIILALNFCFNFSSAQKIKWQNSIGCSGSDRFVSAAKTTDNCIVVLAVSLSNQCGDKSEANMGFEDFWIMKLDSVGNIIWENSIGGSDADFAFGMSATNDGGVICIGSSRSPVSFDKTTPNIGNDDIWVIKLDVNGSIQWQKTFGGPDEDIGQFVQQTPDGGYICGGTTSFNANGLNDFWLCKLDTSGNTVWEHLYGGTDSDQMWCGILMSDGGFACGGNSYSGIGGQKTEPNYGTSDYWVIRTDSLGNLLWNKTLGGTSHDHAWAISETYDGGVIVSGESQSQISGNKTLNTFGSWDMWVVKLNATGNIDWQNTYGGNFTEACFSITQTSDNNYLLGGTSSSGISGNKTEPTAVQTIYWNNDYWLVKIDTSGNIIWQKNYGGDYSDNISKVIELKSNSFFVLGNSGSGSIGDKTEVNHGSTDGWFMIVDESYNSITGNLFIDSNGNLLKDSGEISMPNKGVLNQQTGFTNFSLANGDYTSLADDTGYFSVIPKPVNYYTFSPASHDAQFNAMFETDTLNDFAFQPNGVINDLCISITPGIFRPGRDGQYYITYSNVGTTSIAPTIYFFPADSLTYLSAVPAPSYVSTDTIIWNLPAIPPMFTGNISLSMFLDPSVTPGSILNSTARIDPVAGDSNFFCNYASWEVTVRGSLDPNDIIVNKDLIQFNVLQSGAELDYVINFQNTGTDTAFEVKILNLIDTNLFDMNSFQFMSSSSPVSISMSSRTVFQFEFPGILLPDSTTNEAGSHGYIRYRIAPKTTLSVGDSILNSAAIYFDFNPAVLTNYALTLITINTSVTGLNEMSYQLFPNPANDFLNIKSREAIRSVRILDLVGKTVFEQQLSKSSSGFYSVNISALKKGIYFIELNSATRSKFIKQ